MLAHTSNATAAGLNRPRTLWLLVALGLCMSGTSAQADSEDFDLRDIRPATRAVAAAGQQVHEPDFVHTGQIGVLEC